VVVVAVADLEVLVEVHNAEVAGVEALEQAVLARETRANVTI
jgi:hypothetical protein